MKQAWLVSISLMSAFLGVACSNANIDNKDAVKVAMIEYLDKTKASTGIDPAAMDINVDAVQFERDTARATVSFLIKGSDQGMQGNYTLTRDGNKWGNVTRQNMTAAPHGVSPVGGAAPTPTPEQGKEPLLPVIPGQPSPALPAGHPAVGTK
ncbi:MAG: hypothetical protein ABIR70_19255 [Bryobacteraceae bacterium]